MHITSLSLSAFRNYDQAVLSGLPDGVIALTGANGAGKTNILEAISLLTPGRGLRNADLHSIQNKDHTDTTRPWSIHARLNGRYGVQDLGLGLDPATGRRLIKLNGEVLKTQGERADIIKCVWLTPVHDRLFLDAASARRKLIDRWVFTNDSAHAGRISRFEKLLRERNTILASDAPDALWLDALENDLSETGLAIAIARTDYVDQLRGQINKLQGDDFPRADIALSGFLENRIGHEPALNIEADYRAMLRANRPRDKALEATTTGPHRSDLRVIYTAKNMHASECSTGEQKALLFSLFLSHARLIRDEWDEAPVLLLDEMTAHLDAKRRDTLLTQLRGLGSQIFVTGTMTEAFTGCPDLTLINVMDGHIQRDIVSKNQEHAA